MEIQTQAYCTWKIYQQRSLLALGWTPANKYPAGTLRFSQKYTTDPDMLSMSDFPIRFFRGCCFSVGFLVLVFFGIFLFLFFLNPAFYYNSCIQVSLLESCKYLLQVFETSPLLSVSVPLGRFTAWTNFSPTGCCYCLNNHRMQ